MKIKLSGNSIEKISVEIKALLLSENEVKNRRGKIASSDMSPYGQALKNKDFTGSKDTYTILYGTGKNEITILAGLGKELEVSVDVKGVAGIKAHGCLIETFGVIHMGVATEDMEVTVGGFTPLHLQIACTVMKTAAAVEDDIVVVGFHFMHVLGIPNKARVWRIAFDVESVIYIHSALDVWLKRQPSAADVQ